MDLIRINDYKLKIMLTPSDMACYDLDAETLDYGQEDTRHALRNILDEAKNRTGFDASGDKIYIQLYPSRGGGCELFVTKLELLCAADHAAEQPSRPTAIPPVLSPRAHTVRQSEAERGRSIAFAFDALNDLLCVCRRLQQRSFHGSSSAYHGEQGQYYLLLSGGSGSKHYALFDRDTLAFIHEYGTQQDAHAIRLYIKEHASPICELHAVQRLADL